MHATLIRTGRDDRRKAILDVASDIFIQEGYAAASMSAIAARVGGSKGTLYNYFPSKELLFAALIKQECEAGDWLAFPAVKRAEEIAPALSGIGLRFLDFVFSERVRSINRLVMAESARFPELGRNFYENGPKLGIMALGGWLQTQMREGRLRALDPERAAALFLVLCKSESYQKMLWAVEPAPSSDVRAVTVNTAVEVFMAAFGPQNGGRG